MAGGSRIVISDDGITISTGGKILYQAGQHQFKNGVEVGIDLKGLPSYQPYNEKLKLLSPSGEVMPKVDYQVSNTDQNFTAVTDDKGLSKRINTDSEQDLEIGLQWVSLEKDDDGGQE